MATSEVIGGILLAGDKLLWVEELAVSSGADLVYDGGLQVHKDGPRHVLAGTSLTEERVESIIGHSNRCITVSKKIKMSAAFPRLETEEEPPNYARSWNYIKHRSRLFSRNKHVFTP